MFIQRLFCFLASTTQDARSGRWSAVDGMSGARHRRAHLWRRLLPLQGIVVLAACPGSRPLGTDYESRKSVSPPAHERLAATLLPNCPADEGQAILARMTPSTRAVEARLPHLAPPDFDGPWSCANQERYVALALKTPSESLAGLRRRLALQAASGALDFVAARPSDARPALAAALATLAPDPTCLHACGQLDEASLVDTLTLAAAMASDARLGCQPAVATAPRAGDAAAQRRVATARARLGACPALPQFIDVAAALAVDDATLFATMCLIVTPSQQDSLAALATVDTALGRPIAAQLLRANAMPSGLKPAAMLRLVADLPPAARPELLHDIAALGPMVGAADEVVEALARCSPSRRQSVVAALLAGQRGQMGIVLGVPHLVDQLRQAVDEASTEV